MTVFVFLCAAVLLVALTVLWVRLRGPAPELAWTDAEFTRATDPSRAERCTLCSAPLLPKSYGVAGLELCDLCFAGDFSGRLQPRGFRMQELSWLDAPTAGHKAAMSREVRAGLSFALDLRATFARRSPSLGRAKGEQTRSQGWRRVVQTRRVARRTRATTHHADFDARVGLQTHGGSAERVLDALSDVGLRSAARHALRLVEAFELRGREVVFEASALGAQDRARVRCAAAVLLHALDRVARERNVEPKPTRFPRLAALIERQLLDLDRGSPTRKVQQLFIAYADLDELTAVAELYENAEAAAVPLDGLWIRHSSFCGASLEPISRMRELKSLRFEYVPNLPDLGPLADNTQLEGLTVSHCALEDVRPLQAMARLQALDLSYTRVRDLSPLRALFALESLDLRATLVKDLSPLKDLPALKKVKVRDSKLEPAALRAFTAAQPGVELDRT